MYRRQLIPLALAGALGASALLAQMPGMGRFGQFRQRRMEFIASYLGLTEAQKAEIKDLFAKTQAAAQPIVTELRSTRQAMRDAVKGGKTDQIQALSSKIGALTGQLVALHAQALSKFYTSLTPEQQAKADKLHDFVRPGFGGMHRGPAWR